MKADGAGAQQKVQAREDSPTGHVTLRGISDESNYVASAIAKYLMCVLARR